MIIDITLPRMPNTPITFNSTPYATNSNIRLNSSSATAAATDAFSPPPPPPPVAADTLNTGQYTSAGARSPSSYSDELPVPLFVTDEMFIAAGFPRADVPAAAVDPVLRPRHASINYCYLKSTMINKRQLMSLGGRTNNIAVK